MSNDSAEMAASTLAADQPQASRRRVSWPLWGFTAVALLLVLLLAVVGANAILHSGDQPVLASSRTHSMQDVGKLPANYQTHGVYYAAYQGLYDYDGTPLPENVSYQCPLLEWALQSGADPDPAPRVLPQLDALFAQLHQATKDLTDINCAPSATYVPRSFTHETFRDSVVHDITQATAAMVAIGQFYGLRV
ncbi:MAG TPA: hypothetical protein VLF91_03585 [Candidatus Saccharimonadales bacterium]|nr:hypothetical protein [Candidatus Saccharimonadales bacterium]